MDLITAVQAEELHRMVYGQDKWLDAALAPVPAGLVYLDTMTGEVWEPVSVPPRPFTLDDLLALGGLLFVVGFTAYLLFG